MEYVIVEKTDKYGWCLWKVCGSDDRAHAERCLDREQSENPDKELRIEAISSKDCWWNDSFLSN